MKVNWLLALATVVVAALNGTASAVRAETYTLTDRYVSHRFAAAGCDTCGAADPCGCDVSCDDGCDDGDDACSDEPIRLFPEIGGVTLTGWLNGGAMLNSDDPPSRFNGPLTFADRDEFQVNQVYGVLERAIDTGGCGIDVGGRLDLMFGTDYVFTTAVGLETDQTGAPKWNNRRFYGLAMPQAYGEIGVNNLSMKVGHFYAPVGYESVMATSNFFYTHAYTMQYGEPFTMTGAVATYKVGERFSTYAGVHNGWDIFDRFTERLGLVHGATWVNQEGDVTLFGAVVLGDELNANQVYSSRMLYTLVGTFNLTEKLTYVLQHDNGNQKDYFRDEEDAEWYGINQYLFYTINDCWTAGTRFEWFRDDDGVRVTGVRASNPIAGASFVGDFFEVSSGLNWKPGNNLTVRPELRYDWFEGTGLPYDDATKDDMFTAGLDAYLLW